AMQATYETAITPSAALQRNLRAEPSLGRMDEIVAAVERRPPTPRPRRSEMPKRRVVIPLVVVLLVLGAGAAAWFYQDRLRALLPNSELNGVINRGQKALAENRLVGTQGNSARELFQKARSLDPDNEPARKGLDAVGAKLVELARADLAHNDFAAARNDLAAA